MQLHFRSSKQNSVCIQSKWRHVRSSESEYRVLGDFDLLFLIFYFIMEYVCLCLCVRTCICVSQGASTEIIKGDGILWGWSLFTLSISDSSFIWDTVCQPPSLLRGTCLLSCALHTLSSTWKCKGKCQKLELTQETKPTMLVSLNLSYST